MENMQVLINGSSFLATRYSGTSKQKIIDLIGQIKEISTSVKELGGRSINLPEVLTEGLLCAIFGFVRVNTQGSFDCFDPVTNQTIEVKSTQLLKNDLTSFSPKAFLWDILYFMDFSDARDLKIYTFTKEELNQVRVSSSQGVEDQQKQGRRPRFSLKNLIELNKKQPIHVCSLI